MDVEVDGAGPSAMMVNKDVVGPSAIVVESDSVANQRSNVILLRGRRVEPGNIRRRP